MLKIHDLSKEVDMTAVRGGNHACWTRCGDEDRERFDSDDRHHCERGDRDRPRCERNDDASPSFGCFASLQAGGWYDATK